MKNNRRRGTNALCIGLILLFTVLGMILFANVDRDIPQRCENKIAEGGATKMGDFNA